MTAPGGLAAERFDFLGSAASNLNPFGRFDSSNNFAFAARARNGPSGSTAAANGRRIFLWNGTGFSVVMKQGDAYAGLFDSAAQPRGGAPGNEIAGNAIGAGSDINCTNCFAFDPNAFLRIRFAGSCSRADFDHSGTLDFFDYLDFVDAFSVSSLLADFNADGVIDFFDYLNYVDAFSIGC